MPRRLAIAFFSQLSAAQGFSVKRKNTKKRSRVVRQVVQVAALAPVVASARLARVAASGDYPTLGAMGAEKATAFSAATIGMMFSGAAALARTGLAIANAWSPWGGTARQRMARIESAITRAPADIMDSALAPIRKKVVSNAKRLGR